MHLHMARPGVLFGLGFSVSPSLGLQPSSGKACGEHGPCAPPWNWFSYKIQQGKCLRCSDPSLSFKAALTATRTLNAMSVPHSLSKGHPIGLKSLPPICVQSDHPYTLRNNTNISTFHILSEFFSEGGQVQWNLVSGYISHLEPFPSQPDSPSLLTTVWPVMHECEAVYTVNVSGYCAINIFMFVLLLWLLILIVKSMRVKWCTHT